MFGFARTGVLLLISFVMINNSYSKAVNNNEEKIEHLEVGKLQVSDSYSNKYSITNFRVENSKTNSTVSSIS